MLNAFNIDIEHLRASLQRRQKEVIEGYVSLTDLSM
jgi:hypothetical protein